MAKYDKIKSLFKENTATEFSELTNDLSIHQVDFTNVRGSVRLIHRNVLTPSAVAKMKASVLNFNFGK